MIDWDAELLSPVMAVFGEDQPCRYMPRGGAAFDLADAVFDAEYQEVSIDGDVSASTQTKPILGVRMSLFPAPPKQNDRVLIRSVGKVWIVKDVRPDGHGHAKLMLMATVDQTVV